MTDTLVTEPDQAQDPRPQKIDPYVEERIKRGRAPMVKDAPKVRLNYKFWRGDTYWYLNNQGQLRVQSTVSWDAGGQKPNHVIRNKYPFIASMVEAKTSAATQRVPSYQVIPSTTEPEDGYAAQLAEKVALFGYDEWRLRRATTKVCQHAFIGGEGFAYPFFDTSLGPFVGEGDTAFGLGDVRVLILMKNEVYWEPGTDFDDSRWYVVERAVPKDVLKEMPGYLGGELSSDATDSEAPSEQKGDHLVLLREYLERPSAKRPQGRRLRMANGQLKFPEEAYPCMDHKGQVLDEPVLLRLSYTVDDDRDRSLVERLIDLERTIQDTWNKILEWKNRCLNPRWRAPRGSNPQFTGSTPDAPGSGYYYTVIQGQQFEWETPPAVPRELFQILDTALTHLRNLSADIDVQAEPDLAAQTAVTAVEQSRQRWQSFLGDLAEFHSRLMRRCLYLVQRYYTEPRLVKIQGMWGPDLMPAFEGADLLGQADVRVNPDSLATQTRQQVIQDTLLFADRQWISPAVAMATIQGGVSERLSQAYVLDAGRANAIIQTIKRGPGELFKIPPRPLFPGEPPPVDPRTGQPMQEVQGWMPRPFDNVEIQRDVFETWMKTTDWDRLLPSMKVAAGVYYEALLNLQQQRQAEQAAQQTQMAQALGAANAAKPQMMSPMPDQRGPNGVPEPPAPPGSAPNAQ